MSRINIEGLVKSYGDHTVVHGVDLTVNEGEFVTLLGPSGCGKTTILRAISGLLAPSGGTIRIGGKVVDDPAHGLHVPPNRRNLGMVFQSYALWPHMTVAGNVAYPLRARRRAKARHRDLVEAALEMVGLSGLGDRHVSDLSGGQQQRVAFARALVDRPGVILLDEPLSNLDANLRADMRHQLRELHRELGLTTVFVTHDQLEALTLSDRIVVLQAGNILQEGSPSEVFTEPATPFVARFLGTENFLPGRVVRSTGEMEALVHVPSLGRPVPVTAPSPTSAGAMVEVAVRGTHLKISLCAGGGCGEEAHAQVEDITYLGDALEFALTVGNQSIVVRAAGGRSSIQRGQTVHVGLNGDAVAFPTVESSGENMHEIANSGVGSERKDTSLVGTAGDTV